jgi:sugar O-acyltransferase (sialic acid O-acetyltransferase NeuD family)
MAARELILFGAGEHARVVAETALAAGWTVVGMVDGKPLPPLWPWRLLGGEVDLTVIRQRHPKARFLIAFGHRAGRWALVERQTALPWATVIHPSAVVSPSAAIGGGTLVGPLALLHAQAQVGQHVIVNSGCLVEHDARIEDHVHLTPGVVLGGGAVVGAGAYIGLGARIRDHVTIGAGATVGMGAVVVGTVRPGVTVVGCPARERGP